MDELIELIESLSGGGLGGIVEQISSLKGALGGIGSGLTDILPGIDAAKNGLGQGRDEMGRFTAAGTGLSGMLAQLGPEGEAAAAGLAVLTAALTATIAVLTAASLAAISVTQELSLMASRFGALAGGAAGGQAVLAMVEKLGTQLPFATSQIGEWAGALQRAGIAGKDLEAGVRAIAAAAALNPAGGAEAAQQTLAKLAGGGKEATELIKAISEGSRRGIGALREMGLTVEDLGGKAAVAKMSAAQLSDAIEKALQKKGAGPLAEMGLTFGVIWQKAQEGVLSLFDKLGGAVKPFMGAVKSLFGEFSKGGGVINALKPLVTSVMTTLFAWGTKAVTVIHALVDWFVKSGKAGGMFSGVVAAMRAGWIALGVIWNLVKGYLAPVVSILRAIFTNATVLAGVKAIFTGIAAVVVVLGVVLAGIVGIVAIVVGVIVGIYAAIAGGLAAAVGAVTGFVDDAVGSLSGLTDGALAAAAGFVDGLVDGISNGVGAVVAAVTGLASSALGAFTGVLGIHSPSTVLTEHGEEDMAGAVAGGVDRGAPKVKASMARLGGTASSTGAKGGAGGRGGEKSGPSFTFTGCSFGAGMNEETVRELFARVWEEMARAAGAQPEPQT